MNNMKIIGIVVGFTMIATLLTACIRNNKTKAIEGSGKGTNQGKEAIDFQLKDLQETSHKLSDYKGKKVYIKFWASWCSICLAGLDEINTLSKDDKDFTVITIVSPSFRGEKGPEDFKKWFSGLDYKNMTVLLDEDGAVASKYGVRGYPTSTIIGSDGTLIKTMLGQSSNSQLKLQLETVK